MVGAGLLLSDSPAPYRAFSTLVADRQFSTLGVVLLAILARVGKVIGLPKPALPAVAEPEAEQQAAIVPETSFTLTAVDWGEVVERVFKDREAETSDRTAHGGGRISSTTRTSRDWGGRDTEGGAKSLLEVRVTKEDEAGTESGLVGAGNEGSGAADSSRYETTAPDRSSGKTPLVVEQKNKRRKKGNAIDELFAGLY